MIMESLHVKTKFGRLLLLVFSSTVIAEVLSGSTTLSRIQFLPTQFLLYGSAVILIREVSRRLNAGWLTTILLGLVFGLTLEGLVLQSVFNPSFLTNDLTFGRSMGTNWVWALYMPPFHALFSICTPIILCEVVFGDDEPRPWASRTVVWVAGIILLFLFVAFHFLFIKLTHFSTGIYSLLILFAVIVVVALIALKARNVKFSKQPAIDARPSYHFALITLATLVAVLLWYYGFQTIFAANKPQAWIPLAAAPVIIFAYFAAITHIRLIKIYTMPDWFALSCGALFGETFFGYFATASNKEDHYAQLVLMGLVVILLGLLYIKVSKTRQA
jgi:hypothetical protein